MLHQRENGGVSSLNGHEEGVRATKQAAVGFSPVRGTPMKPSSTTSTPNRPASGNVQKGHHHPMSPLEASPSPKAGLPTAAGSIAATTTHVPSPAASRSAHGSSPSSTAQSQENGTAHHPYAPTTHSTPKQRKGTVKLPSTPLPAAAPGEISMDQVKLLFGSIDVLSLGYISRFQFEEILRDNGMSLNDSRLQEVKKRLEEGPTSSSSSAANTRPGLGRSGSISQQGKGGAKEGSAAITDGSERIDLKRFAYIIQPNASLIERIIRRQLVIPDWQSFTQILTEIFHEVKSLSEGKVADYIPELALADAGWFGVSFCSVDGQLFSIGDTNKEFSVQSSSKPISYLMALDELGEDEVHRYVGREPSGRNFNDICLNPEMIPHNPMVNSGEMEERKTAHAYATNPLVLIRFLTLLFPLPLLSLPGAIMTCSLIKHGVEQSARFRFIMEQWSGISGEKKYVTFSNSTYLSERATADRNFCLGYMMQGPETTRAARARGHAVNFLLRR
jgi:hypothetical protein